MVVDVKIVARVSSLLRKPESYLATSAIAKEIFICFKGNEQSGLFALNGLCCPRNATAKQ